MKLFNVKFMGFLYLILISLVQVLHSLCIFVPTLDHRFCYCELCLLIF